MERPHPCRCRLGLDYDRHHQSDHYHDSCVAAYDHARYDHDFGADDHHDGGERVGLLSGPKVLSEVQVGEAKRKSGGPGIPTARGPEDLGSRGGSGPEGLGSRVS
jgi:hypothetical protein